MKLRPGKSLSKAFKEVKKQMKRLENSRKEKKAKPIPECSLEPYEIEQEPFKGTGQIFISGTTVHGIETKFLKELQQNDQLIIKQNNSEEKRKVILVLSDKSACISAAFPNEATTEYFIEKPPIKIDPKSEENPEKKRKIEENGEIYQVRVKRGPWTYQVDKVNTTNPLSNEDLLNVRAQRVRDKFCWM